MRNFPTFAYQAQLATLIMATLIQIKIIIIISLQVLLLLLLMLNGNNNYHYLPYLLRLSGVLSAFN